MSQHNIPTDISRKNRQNSNVREKPLQRKNSQISGFSPATEKGGEIGN